MGSIRPRSFSGDRRGPRFVTSSRRHAVGHRNDPVNSTAACQLRLPAPPTFSMPSGPGDSLSSPGSRATRRPVDGPLARVRDSARLRGGTERAGISTEGEFARLVATREAWLAGTKRRPAGSPGSRYVTRRAARGPRGTRLPGPASGWPEGRERPQAARARALRAALRAGEHRRPSPRAPTAAEVAARAGRECGSLPSSGAASIWLFDSRSVVVLLIHLRMTGTSLALRTCSRAGRPASTRCWHLDDGSDVAYRERAALRHLVAA